MLDKCPHGVYLAEERTARYCTLCNPELVNDRTLRVARRAAAKTKPDQERLLDAAEFMAQPPGARIAEADYTP